MSCFLSSPFLGGWGWVWVVVAPRSWTFVPCGVAQGWNIDGYASGSGWCLVASTAACLPLLVGGVGGGKAWWVLVGVGDEARCWVLKDHTVGVPGLVGGRGVVFWWSAPGPQTVVVSPLLVVVGVWWWVWVVGVVLLVC